MNSRLSYSETQKLLLHAKARNQICKALCNERTNKTTNIFFILGKALGYIDKAIVLDILDWFFSFSESEQGFHPGYIEVLKWIEELDQEMDKEMDKEPDQDSDLLSAALHSAIDFMSEFNCREDLLWALGEK